MATVNVTTSKNINAVSYVTGDTVYILGANGVTATLTIDQSVPADVTKIESTAFPNIIGAGAAGKLLIQNASTTVPLIIPFNTLTNRYVLYAYALGMVQIQGAWISLATSTGALGQTIALSSFPSGTGRVIDFPPCIWAEVTAGSGNYIPLFNIRGAHQDGNNTAYVNYAQFVSFGSTPELGGVFEYDEYTHTIYLPTVSGQGWVPPNGANIRIPNIHITAINCPTTSNTRLIPFVNNANYGNYNLDTVAFSDRFVTSTSGLSSNSLTVNNVGQCCGWNFLNVHSYVSITKFCSAPDWWAGAIGNNISLTDCAATTLILDKIYCASMGGTSAGYITVLNCSLTNVGSLYALDIAKTNTFQAGIVSFSNIAAAPLNPILIGPITCVGWRLDLLNCSNIIVNGFNYSDTLTGIPTATNAGAPLKVNGCQNCVVKTVRLLTNGTPAKANFINVNAANSGFALHDVIYDGYNYNTSANWVNNLSVGVTGSRTWFSNINIKGANCLGNTGTDWTSQKTRISNCRSVGSAPTTVMLTTPFMEVDMASDTGSASSANVDTPHAKIFVTSADNTVGTINLQWACDKDKLETYVLNGAFTKGVDYIFAIANGIGGMYLPTTGMDVTWMSTTPLRGVTGMASTTFWMNNSSGYGTTSFPAGLTATVRMSNAGSGVWGNWYTLGTAGMASAFAALSGYNSNVGFDIQTRLQTSTNDATRWMAYCYFSGLVVDAAFVSPEVGFIQVGISGAYSTASVSVFDNTTPASPVLVGSGVATAGSITFEYPYSFSGVAAPIKFVARAYGYKEAISASSSYQAGIVNPVAMPIDSSIQVDFSTAAAYTGITITGSASAITISANRTFQQLYDYAQAWAYSNLSYNTPITGMGAAGNVSMAATGNITINSGYVINGSGTLSFTTNTLTTEFTGAVPYSYTGGTYTSGTWGQATNVPSFNGGQLSIGALGTYVFTMNTAIISMTPGAAGTYTMSGGSFVGTIDLRNTTAYAITVRLPPGTTTTTTNNTGGTITVDTSVTVTVGVTVTAASTSTPIQNARVYLIAAAGGPLSAGTVILSGLTDASGVYQNTAFTYTSSQPVTGHVRKATGSPLYKAVDLSGAIGPGGYSASVLMIGDE